MISYLGSVLYEAHKTAFSKPKPSAGYIECKTATWSLLPKAIFLLVSIPPLLSSLFPPLLCLCLTCFPWCSYDYSVLVYCKYGPSLYSAEKCTTLCGYCVLSLYFPHILLFYFFSVTLSHMHCKYSHTWHLGKSPDVRCESVYPMYMFACVPKHQDSFKGPLHLPFR